MNYKSTDIELIARHGEIVCKTSFFKYILIKIWSVAVITQHTMEIAKFNDTLMIALSVKKRIGWGVGGGLSCRQLQ